MLKSPDHLICGKWKLLNKLGSGSFGDIYVGLSPTDNEKVAVKLVFSSSFDFPHKFRNLFQLDILNLVMKLEYIKH